MFQIKLRWFLAHFQMKRNMTYCRCSSMQMKLFFMKCGLLAIGSIFNYVKRVAGLLSL